MGVLLWARYPCTPLTPIPGTPLQVKSEFFIDNLLVRVHVIIVMIKLTGLATREFESPLPGSLASTSQLEFEFYLV